MVRPSCLAALRLTVSFHASERSTGNRRDGPLENACDVFAGAALSVGKIVTKAEDATIARHELPLADCRQPLRRGGCAQLRGILRQRLVSTDDHARRTVRAHGSECGSVLRRPLDQLSG